MIQQLPEVKSKPFHPSLTRAGVRIMCAADPENRKLIATITGEGINVYCMYAKSVELVTAKDCIDAWLTMPKIWSDLPEETLRRIADVVGNRLAVRSIETP